MSPKITEALEKEKQKGKRWQNQKERKMWCDYSWTKRVSDYRNFDKKKSVLERDSDQAWTPGKHWIKNWKKIPTYYLFFQRCEIWVSKKIKWLFLQGIRPATLSLSFREASNHFADKYLISEKSYEKLLGKVHSWILLLFVFNYFHRFHFSKIMMMLMRSFLNML